MILKSFEAKNFRNIESCKINFSEGVNVLIGENAQGKTNVAEGIYLFARGRAFRTSDEKELIRFNTEGFNIAVDYESRLGKERLEYSLYGKQRQRKKNGYKVSKITEMIGSFKAVLFVPADLTLVKGLPEERRSFLNIAVSQCYEDYIKHYQGYKTALENRNCILKNAKSGLYFDENEFYSWSKSLASYASVICLYRREYIQKLEAYAKKVMLDISDSAENLTLSYKSDISDDIVKREDIQAEYERIFASEVSREIGYGASLFGPHRDDIEIEINGKSARSFASQGQARSAVLSLKIAEGEVIKELFSEYPVFIFDDVMSELDKFRRDYILNNIKNKQIIITSCEREIYKDYIDNYIEVKEGKYVYSHR